MLVCHSERNEESLVWLTRFLVSLGMTEEKLSALSLLMIAPVRAGGEFCGIALVLTFEDLTPKLAFGIGGVLPSVVAYFGRLPSTTTRL